MIFEAACKPAFRKNVTFRLPILISTLCFQVVFSDFEMTKCRNRGRLLSFLSG